MFASLKRQELARQVAHPKKENQILRVLLPKRLVTTPEERGTLLKAGKNIGSKLKELISIVSYDSFLHWIREAEQGSARKKSRSPGRPGTEEDLHQLIVQMHEGTRDGHTLLEGRLKRLGYQVFRTTIHNVLKASCLI